MAEQRFVCLKLGFKRDMSQAIEHLEELKVRMKKISPTYPAYTSIQDLAIHFALSLSLSLSEKKFLEYLLNSLKLGRI